LTVHTFSNDQASVKRCRNYIIGCSTYAKEETDDILGN
jgi:hypothetical protein